MRYFAVLFNILLLAAACNKGGDDNEQESLASRSQRDAPNNAAQRAFWDKADIQARDMALRIRKSCPEIFLEEHITGSVVHFHWRDSDLVDCLERWKTKADAK